jgi:hypothetical protein
MHIYNIVPSDGEKVGGGSYGGAMVRALVETWALAPVCKCHLHRFTTDATLLGLKP